MLLQKLRDAFDYRLTLVQAGTGYGKTTALSALDTGDFPLFWYSAEEADADPQRFLSYLIAAFRTRLPTMSDLPLAVLADRGSEGTYEVWAQTLDALINVLIKALPGPALLIVDDYHFVSGSPEINSLTERLITFLPANLHIIISTRHPLTTPGLARWRTHGDVQEIGDATLAFRPAEIEALFRTVYGMQLAPQEIASLAEKTDGWPIALQMVWQDLRNDTTQSAKKLLTAGPASLAALFDYLAREVLARQPTEVATFLRDTAVLRKLTPATCAAVTSTADSAVMLDRLHHLDLFVVALGEQQYRYHHLFHDFLRQQAAADSVGTQERHRQAAQFFETQHDQEEAIYHWLASHEFPAAAAVIARAGDAALLAGRLGTVASWIDTLPPGVLASNPLLQVYRGDVFRLRTDFDKALAWYAQAEQTCRVRGDKAGISRALRGRASIYLDIVQPAEGEHVLEEALRLIDGTADREAHARLLELVAENKLNMGEPDKAAALWTEARALREEAPDEDVVSVRVKFRTGRLIEARDILEGWVAAEREAVEPEPARPPRAHRENLLLLSITYAFLGQAEPAIASARAGIELGERLRSPFITAVGKTRLGHALQLRRGQAWPPDSRDITDEAISCFQAALAVSDQLAVRRARIEARWGLTRAYGFSGDVEAAQRAAEEGIATARLDGDAWLAAMIELMLGASYVLAGRCDEAVALLSRTLITLRECGDSFGRAATRLWLSLAYLALDQREHFATCVETLLDLCESHNYECLFTAPSMLAPPDSRRLVPLLLEARARRCRPTYVARLLAMLGL
ncbi:MAG TPA: transcriptional regulator, partial [Roseiflexaceae bacterium]|nr:transcriptional regulator [Roseiflexaceae bacterium]